ncbi:MAG: hypothetical protein BWY11_00746 [Firmicutes bacterium ADurb.Bin182]|nr:MAG: hypothetical protein BWY11_00746 [Firmicutes bacterium ADurb.Bin182]
MDGMDKAALRDLLTQTAKPLYQRAFELTGDPEKAKGILREIVKESTAAAASMTITEEWLNGLCDRLARPKDNKPEEAESIFESEAIRPAEGQIRSERLVNEFAEAAEVPGNPVMPRRVKRTMPTEPQPNTEADDYIRPAKADKPVQATSVSTESPDTEKPYSLDDDEWINELRENRKYRQNKPEREKTDSRGLYNAAIVLCVPLILILLWIVAGLLMKNGALPYSDLGYDWFNANVWNLF